MVVTEIHQREPSLSHVGRQHVTANPTNAAAAAVSAVMTLRSFAGSLATGIFDLANISSDHHAVITIAISLNAWDY
jgi:hypothetical protein